MNLIKKIKLELKEIKKTRKSKKLLNLYSRNNFIEVKDEDLPFVRLKVDGAGNTIHVKKLKNHLGVINITIIGNNNMIIIEEGASVSGNLTISLGKDHQNFGPIENTRCNIGKNCSFESCKINSYNSNCEINIGDRCMVSYNVRIYHTDGHPVMDYETGNIINKVKDLNIGEHVWLGANCTILKNTNIPDNSIVGWGSIVSGKHYSKDESGIVLAGNPAKVVKEGITWSSDGSNGYVQNIYKC